MGVADCDRRILVRRAAGTPAVLGESFPRCRRPPGDLPVNAFRFQRRRPKGPDKGRWRLGRGFRFSVPAVGRRRRPTPAVHDIQPPAGHDLLAQPRGSRPCRSALAPSNRVQTAETSPPPRHNVVQTRHRPAGGTRTKSRPEPGGARRDQFAASSGSLSVASLLSHLEEEHDDADEHDPEDHVIEESEVHGRHGTEGCRRVTRETPPGSRATAFGGVGRRRGRLVSDERAG